MSTRTPRVLLVDDDSSIREFLALYLRRIVGAANVFEAPDGDVASEIVLAHDVDFDLIVTDYAMPRMNGTDLIRVVRGSGYTMPIIVLTGHKDRAQDMIDAGAQVVLEKPIRYELLKQVVKKLLPL